MTISHQMQKGAFALVRSFCTGIVVLAMSYCCTDSYASAASRTGGAFMISLCVVQTSSHLGPMFPMRGGQEIVVSDALAKRLYLVSPDSLVERKINLTAPAKAVTPLGNSRVLVVSELSGAGQADIIDLDSNSIVERISLGNGSFGDVVVQGSMAHILRLDEPSVISVDISRAKISSRHPLPAKVSSAAGGRDATYLYLAGKQLWRFDTTSGRVSHILNLPSEGAMTASRDGQRIALLPEFADRLYLIDAATMKLSQPVQAGLNVGKAIFSPDARHIYVTYKSAGDLSTRDATGKISSNVDDSPTPVLVIDTARARVVDHIPVGVGAENLAISPDGQTLYVSNYGTAGGPKGKANVAIVDIESKRVIQQIEINSKKAASPCAGG